jgi:subtilisin family serine protease
VTWHENLQHPKARHEAAIVASKFAERDIAIGGAATHDGWIAHMHAQDQFLVREQYLGGVEGTQRPQNIPGPSRQRGVLDVLQEHGVVNVEVRRVVRDIVLVRLNPDRREDTRQDSPESNDAAPESNAGNAEGNDRPSGGNGDTPEGDQRDVLYLLDRIEEEFGPRIATLDHVVTTAQGHPSGCPATEPQEVYDPHPNPYPPVCPGKGGDGVRIYVADTGIVTGTVASCPWLDGVTGDDDPSVAADGTILPYGGHGTFVAGVIRSMAPGAEVRVENVFDTAGSALESDFVAKLNAGFAYGAEIFHVTVASRTKDNNPLMAFEAWMEHLQQHKGVVCVVPAGNSGSRMPSWPAAFPGIISVGALATDWRSRAYFSDFGGWVDVYAPGQNLVNAFATGTYTCQVAPYESEIRTFSGMAQWSGTSFSTPIVTGLIAARMARCGESGQEAAAALLAQARAEAIPGVGPVLLPYCDDDDQCHGGRYGHSRGGGSHGCGGGHGCGCGGHGCGGDCGRGHGKHGSRPR